MTFVVCAFYTKGTFYEDEAVELIETAERFGLKHDVRGYQSRGTWVRNASIKPEFIHTMLLEHPDDNILYVDVDARFRQYPSLYDGFEGDIGVHYRDKRRTKKGKELLSGTIFFRNNEAVRNLVKTWIDYQQAQQNTWDQRVLNEVIEKHAEALGVRVVDTPPQYTQIFDSMRKYGEPVIEHMQASRRARKKGLTREGVPGYAFIYLAQSIARRLSKLGSRMNTLKKRGK